MATRVKLVVSHRDHLRTQVKMAQVDGCTFFRRVTDGQAHWKHVDKSCKRIFHWLWSAMIQIGECMLVIKDGAVAYQGSPCAEAMAYLALKTKIEGLDAAMEKEPVATKKVELARELNQACDQFETMKKPFCLEVIQDPRMLPETISVGGCVFTLEGDVFKHQHRENTSRCKLREHYQDTGEYRIRMTRKPGWDLEAFSKAAVPAIEKAVAQAPANPHEHIIVDVE